jgi:hypothetical protein
METLEMLEMISRSHPNRLLLKHFGIFPDLIALATASIRKLDIIISDKATETTDKLKTIEFVRVRYSKNF